MRIFGDLLNSCRWRVEGGGNIVYDFLLSYIDDQTPYTHNDDCFEHQVRFIKVDDPNSTYNPLKDS